MQNWPPTVREQVNDLLGPAVEVQPLGGMSGASVVRLLGRQRSAVLKQTVSPVEPYVYTRLSPALLEAGIGLPALYASFDDGGTFWLLLEDIPNPLPSGRWHADPEQLAMLRQLHTFDQDTLALPTRTYAPEWPPAMTASALALFEGETASHIVHTLETARDQALHLFAPHVVMSGDPNPANWGVREDGSLVLFDWERCTYGQPALDLAITVPGLGDREAFERVANVYAGSPELAPDIAAAKVWVITEFLAGYARGDVVPSFDIRRLLATFPAWIRAVVNPRR